MTDLFWAVSKGFAYAFTLTFVLAVLGIAAYEKLRGRL